MSVSNWTVLCNLFAEMVKRHGKGYEPHSLSVMLSSLDRHLNDNKKPFSIVRTRKFAKSRAVMHASLRRITERARSWPLAVKITKAFYCVCVFFFVCLFLFFRIKKR